LAKSGTCWLFDPDNVCQIDPGILILHWAVRAILPECRPILL
jgi:hypothetical protein